MVMLNALTEKLRNLNVDFIRIDGTTRSDLRAAYIDRFQKKETCQVAVLSLKGILNDAHVFVPKFHIMLKSLQLVMQQSRSLRHRLWYLLNLIGIQV